MAYLLQYYLSVSIVNISLVMTSHYWDAETGENDCVSGKGHTNQVTKLVVDEDDELVTCSMDDTVRYTDAIKREYK